MENTAFNENMQTGFLAYQLVDSKWRYSEFVTPEGHPEVRSMITFKGNGYGWIYADSMAGNCKRFHVCATLADAEKYCRMQNVCIQGKKEDERLIYGRNSRW